MRTFVTCDFDDYMIRATVSTKLRIPFFQSLIQAGFPSPATDYIERVCDLNDLCIHNPEATYFVRAAGDSMTGDRIEPGDILIVDSSYQAVDGRIVVVCLNGDNLVKRVHYAGGPTGDMVVLMSSNPKYDPIYVHKGENFRVFGVVTFVIQKTR